MKSIILLCITLFLGIQLNAQKTYNINSVPNPKTLNDSWVSDPDGFLKAETVQLLNKKIDGIEQLNGTEVAVVVLGSIGNENPADFATDLFNYWGIGKKPADNGLLILMVMDKRRVEFRTGYGLEATLTDARCVQIQQDYMVPEFKKGDYDNGLIAGLDVTARKLVGDEKWEITPLKDEKPILEKLSSKLGSKIQKNQFVFDVSNLLADTLKKNAAANSAYLKDSLETAQFFYIFSDLEGISPQKMGFYLNEKYKISDSFPNVLIWTFDWQKSDFYLFTQFNDPKKIFFNTVLTNYISSTVESVKSSGPEIMFQRTVTEMEESLNDSLRALKIEAELKKLQEDPPVYEDDYSYDDYQSSGGNFWWVFLKFYLWALAALVVLAFVFIGVVQKIEDPYKKYHTLTFFALDIWIYLFPLPYFWIGRWIDQLRKQYRDAPRNDPKTGQPMTRLDEKEEDKYLKAGQITEENINSIHYDVWATADRSNLLILPYPTLFTKYSRCIKCSFKAYYLVFNRTIRAATTSSSGLGEKKYECKHCGHTHQYTYVIPRKTESRSSSGGGGGSSGGSFGGGSSGGGGGGSSW